MIDGFLDWFVIYFQKQNFILMMNTVDSVIKFLLFYVENWNYGDAGGPPGERGRQGHEGETAGEGAPQAWQDRYRLPKAA